MSRRVSPMRTHATAGQSESALLEEIVLGFSIHAFPLRLLLGGIGATTAASNPSMEALFPEESAAEQTPNAPPLRRPGHFIAAT